MVDDPYRVLGVSRDATPEQIKSAYRRRSKECHPDLHPDDPDASRKMNDVNEAYDMLTHPEKYAARQASRASQSQSSYNTYRGGYSGERGTYDGQGYEQRQYQSQSSYQGPGGWASSDFDDFDFFKMFFGGGYSGVDTDPVHEGHDDPNVYAAIEYINRRSYQDAVRSLVKVPSFSRNARWYYLMSLAQHGAGNVQRAYEYIQKAIELDRNNRVYQALYNKYSRNERGGSPFSYTYSTGRSNYYDDGEDEAYEPGSGYSIFGTGGILRGMIRFIGVLLLLRFLMGGLYSCMFFV